MCHSAMLITQQHKDSSAWERTITQMEKWGAPVPPEQRDSLRTYLMTTFGPATAPERPSDSTSRLTGNRFTRILCGRDAGFLLTRLTGQGQAGSASAFAPRSQWTVRRTWPRPGGSFRSTLTGSEISRMRFRPHLALAAWLLAGATTLTPPHACLPHRASPSRCKRPRPPLPYVDFITICGQSKCDPSGQPICPTDSLVIQIGGHFPNACFKLRSDRAASDAGVAAVEPGDLVIVSDGSCTGTPTCPDSLVPWSAQIVLGPQLLGMHNARVALGVTDCPGGEPQAGMDTMTTVPFTVAQCENAALARRASSAGGSTRRPASSSATHRCRKVIRRT